MPYKSKAQARYFHYLQSKGKMSPETVSEFDESSKGKDLPEKMAMGGQAPLNYFGGGEIPEVEDQVDYGYGEPPEAPTEYQGMADGGFVHGESEDDMMGSYHPHDSSGEPDTNEYFEEEHPMKYLAHGGMVEKIQHGEINPAHNKQSTSPGPVGPGHQQHGTPVPKRNKEKAQALAKGGMVKHAFAKAIMKSKGYR